MKQVVMQCTEVGVNTVLQQKAKAIHIEQMARLARSRQLDSTMVTCLLTKSSVCRSCAVETYVKSKGRDPYALSFLVSWIRGLGYKKLVCRSDNEALSLALLTLLSVSLPETAGFYR